MAQAQFPEPRDLEVPTEKRIGDGTSISFAQYDVSNPHPGFGKDPNILNEYGHTKYPMWIDSEITGGRVIVNDPHEHAQHTGKTETQTKPKSPWDTK